MTIAFSVELEFDAALRELHATAARLGNLGPVHRQIGELLVESTRQRFVASKAPDGSGWTPLSEHTIAKFVAGFHERFRRQDGELRESGERRRDGRKPLVGETRSLSTTIFYEVSGDGNELAVGSPMVYAAVQNFGQKKGASGTTKHGHAIPFGDIPARQFIGLSTDDEAMIAEKLQAFIMDFGST